MNIENKKFIFDEFGVSGREEKVRNAILNFSKGMYDDYKIDANGSLGIIKKGNGKDKKTILFSAHMDIIGYVITHIDDEGFLKFNNIGGQRNKFLPGSRVVFENGLYGVIGVEAGKEIKDVSSLYIDIGADSKEDAKKMVKIGDTCSRCNDFIVQNNKMISSWLDDRIGCFILLEVLEQIDNPYNDIVFLFSTQEEVGLRGATTAVANYNPDFAFALDVTMSNDTPKFPKIASSKFGGGAAIKIKDGRFISPLSIVEKLELICDENNIKYQRDIIPGGSTDASAIEVSGKGVFTGAISIPSRNIHLENEIVDINDVQACIDLTRTICCNHFDIK